MWDKEKAVQYLTSHANVTSLGRCAEYTRKAIEAGDLVLDIIANNHIDQKVVEISS